MPGIASGGTELWWGRTSGPGIEAAIEGYVAGLSKEEVPANQRFPIPYEGLDRLAYWQAHRTASTAAKERRRDSGREYWRYYPPYPPGVAAARMDAFAPAERGAAVWSEESGEKISRRSFLKVALSSIPVAALAFAAGCGGGEDEGEDEGEDD